SRAWPSPRSPVTYVSLAVPLGATAPCLVHTRHATRPAARADEGGRSSDARTPVHVALRPAATKEKDGVRRHERGPARGTQQVRTGPPARPAHTGEHPR